MVKDVTRCNIVQLAVAHTMMQGCYGQGVVGCVWRGVGSGGANIWKMIFFFGGGGGGVQGLVRVFSDWSGKSEKDLKNQGKIKESESYGLLQQFSENILILLNAQ